MFLLIYIYGTLFSFYPYGYLHHLFAQNFHAEQADVCVRVQIKR